MKHHHLTFKNTLKIKEIGVEKWLSQQEAEHICKCGGKKLWFSTKCNNKEC
ncbi:hypothetical protein [Alkaliphilus pronyensis]|uniref:hypothetical protein n=1 Tax=Alkaliphilus pronyensis TaxID=1482732 RepID=UPI0018657BE6|nr:hypothetical protein [Alkaliphilus pronyensis]